MSFINKEKEDIKNILTRIKKRDFSGNTGIAIRNSSYQFSTNIIAKIGSLFFTIIIARLLMPDLFGLYSLAIGTIVLISGFSELGVSKALIKFLSRAIGNKENSKAKSYLAYFLKIKLILLFATSITILVLAKFLATSYYDKPIYLALLAGGLYIFITGLTGFFESVLHSFNKFKPSLVKETTFQVLRIFLVPLVILYSLKEGFSSEKIIFYIILALSFIYILNFIFIFISSKRESKFIKQNKRNLSFREKKEANSFLLIISATILSGIFLGYIDMFMLGHFVESKFIGFYSAAFSLVGAMMALIPFSVILFPIFSRMKGKQLEIGMKKSLGITFTLALFFTLITFILAPLAIKIIYGTEYAPAIGILRILSILVLITPLTALYADYFFAKNLPKIIAKSLIFTTILNIILNYYLITYFLSVSPLMASIGAASATIFSKLVFFWILFFSWKKSSKLSPIS